ncbi:DUF1573 domain-containing protein [Tuwongella immobilis]|uniref:DUF1573 domain-containing protein n=1 Tax=Tuwongella immobilis TaxID=692036 RepID=A0A6C2YWU3_9BACT|nr:DUF1573 domain-containing protein [Tuwongella immobilis]VIP05379.1 unnamed protein product [Tuwongella immobilis]VTS08114.1 unnamed protein product [Tuwongella immobilis]
MTWIIRICSIGAIGLFLAAAWYKSQPAPQRTLTLVNSEVDLGEIPLDRTQFAIFTIRNEGDEPKRILDFANTCTFYCCYQAVLEGPQVIPPHSEIQYVIEVKATATKPFTVNTTLSLEDNGLRPERILIHGIGVSQSETADASPRP